MRAHNGKAPVVAIEAPVAVRQTIRVGWLLRLPYPLRNALGRWRALVTMILGVGIALSIGMTLLAVISAGDTPGVIQNARAVLAQVRGWPEVQVAIGVRAAPRR